MSGPRKLRRLSTPSNCVLEVLEEWVKSRGGRLNNVAMCWVVLRLPLLGRDGEGS